MTPPTDDLTTLRKLRDEAVDYGTIDCCDHWDSSKFYHAAYAALGLGGCVTKELERLRAEFAEHDIAAAQQDSLMASCIAERNDLQKQLDVEVTVGARLVDENETLASENKLLHARCERLEAEDKAILQRTKDFCGACASEFDAFATAKSEPPQQQPTELLDVLEFIASGFGPQSGDECRDALKTALRDPKSVSTLSPCPRCGETVPTTFRDGLLTYRCMRCAGDAP